MRKSLLAAAVFALALFPAYGQTGTILNPKILNRTRNVEQYATAGAGTSASPWTGWEAATIAAIQAGFPVHWSAGEYATPDFEIPILVTNVPSKASISGDGSGTTRITITDAAGRFRIYGSGVGTRVLDNVTIDGLTIANGANNSSAGLVSLENFDSACSVRDLFIDATGSFTTNVGLLLLNDQHVSLDAITVRGSSATAGAPGNVSTCAKIYTDDGIQRGNIGFGSLYVNYCTTGLSISSSGGSLNNIRFGTFKAVNGSLVDGTTAVSLGGNAEQITFDDSHVESFNSGLVASGVEQITFVNSVWGSCHNVANTSGTCISIADGDGATVLTPRINSSYNGVALSGTTTRAFVTRGKLTAITGSFYSDTSTGRNFFFDGLTDLTSNDLGPNECRFGNGGILCEGSTRDNFQTFFTQVDPTADRTITWPDASGTPGLLSRAQTWTATQTFGAGTDTDIDLVFDQGTGTDPIFRWFDAGNNFRFVTAAGTLDVPNRTATVATSTGILTNGHVPVFDASGNLTDSGSTPAGAPAFSSVTAGTNTTAAMVVGTGGSLSTSGSGTIAATSVPGTGVSGNISGTSGNVSGTVDVTHGGTNFTSGTTGDVPYLSAATVMSKLADVATGSAIISGGVGVAPSYGKIGLTTHVSGTLPATNGGTGLASGTSGGVNYWSSSTTMASSAALASGGIVIGGGAGSAPASSSATATAAGSIAVPTGQNVDVAADATAGGSVCIKEGADDGVNQVCLKVPDSGLSGDKTLTFKADGAVDAAGVEHATATSKCARFDASGILVAASGDCTTGGGGSGTVTAVGSCASGDCFTSATPAASLVFNNATSGKVTLQTVTGALGTVTMSLPAATDTIVGKATTDTLTNKTLDAEGTGNVLTTVEKVWLPAAGCNGAVGAPFWDLPASLAPTASCVAGTNTNKAYLDFPDSDGAYSAQTTLELPADWTGTVDAKIKWLSPATSGNVFWRLSTICVGDGATDDPAFNTASTVADAAKGTANQTNDATITGLTMTGCSAGQLLHLKIMRDRTDASDTLGAGAARLIGIDLTLRRAQ